MAHTRGGVGAGSGDLALTEQVQALGLLLEQVPVIVWSTDADLRITSSLGTGLAELGLRPGEAIERSLSQYDRPGGSLADAHLRALRGESVSYESVWDEIDRAYEVRVEPLRATDGTIIGTVGLVLDVTESKRAQALIVFHASLLDQVRSAVVATDLSGKIIYWNAFAVTLYQWAPEEVIGRNIFEIMTRRKELAATRDVLEAVETEVDWEGELEVTRKDGTTFPAHMIDVLLRDARGDAIGFVGVSEDVSECRRAAVALRRSSARREAAAALSQFALANHDLQAVFEQAVARVAAALEVEHTAVLELQPDGRALLLRAGAGWEDGLVGSATVLAGVDSDAGHTLLSDEPSIIEDLGADDRFRAPNLLLDHGLVTGVSVIIRTEAGAFGVLGAYSRSARSLGQDDTSFLQVVAGILGQSIGRRTVEAASRPSDEDFRRLAEHAQHALFRFRTGSNPGFEYVNPAMVQMTGYTEAELCGDPELGWRIVHAEDRSLLDQAIASAAPAKVALRWVRKNGDVAQVEQRIVPIRDEQGKVVALDGMVRDLTERVRAEKEHALLTAIVEASNDAIIATASDGVITAWNPAAERIYGYTAEEIIGKPLSTLAPAGRLDDLEWILGMLARGEVLESFETVRRRKDGELINVELSASPIRDEFGKMIGTSAIVRDVTERARAARDLRASEKKFRALVSNIPGAVYRRAFDDEHTIELMSDKIEAISGYPASDFVGSRVRSFGSIIHPGDRTDFEQKLRASVEAGSPFELEYRIRHADGSVRWVNDRGQAVRGPAGEILWLDGVALDITGRKKVERQLRQLNLELEKRVAARTRELMDRTEEASRAWEEARRANAEKTKFLSRLSHELRTPLNAILGFTQLLELDARPADRDSIERILQAGRHVLDLVNEVLDISRIEGGSLPVVLVDLVVDEIVEDVLDVAGSIALERGVSLQSRGTPSSPHVLADRQRLTEVLLNLVVNGIVYNREGGSVLVSYAPESGRVRIEVSDTGPGIAPEDLTRLFAPFERLGRTEKEAGAGLGLALSQLLIEAMGGTISASSVPGEGTTLSFDLPAAGGPADRE